jgi:Rrf2 family protein
MMWTRSSDMAMRAALYLAEQRRWSTVAEMANREGLPRFYLAKVLKMLASHGLLRSRRGPSGGFMLAFPPERVTLSQILESLRDGPRPDGGLLATRCRRCLERTTLADVLKAMHAPGNCLGATASCD